MNLKYIYVEITSTIYVFKIQIMLKTQQEYQYKNPHIMYMMLCGLHILNHIYDQCHTGI